MNTTQLAPGVELDGFILGERLSNGGMGTIWRASRADLAQPVVLKVPMMAPGGEVSSIIGFEVEEMIMKRLTGPHVPRFHGSGDLSRIPYIAMEFVEGPTLEQQLKQAPLPADAVRRIGIDVAMALDDLHRQHVSHLDLKPGNIILALRGAVLIDFGLARHDELPDLLAEESTVPMGSAAYIAPEQVFGDRSNPTSDLFALGAILYTLATGEKPFGEPMSAAGMQRRAFRAPPPPQALVKTIPRWLQEVILKCIEVDPSARYASAAQLLFDLNHPEQVPLTARGRIRTTGDGIVARIKQWFGGNKLKPPRFRPSIAARLAQAPMVLAAVDLAQGADPLAEEVRVHLRRVLEADVNARLACLTILKTKIVGEDAAVDASGRPAYVGRLVALRDWARPLDLPEEKVSFHVLEAIDPGGAILDYANRNRVDHIVLGARGSSALRRHLGSVSAHVVAEALCSVTVVRLKAAAAEAVTEAEIIAAELAEAGMAI